MYGHWSTTQNFTRSMTTKTSTFTRWCLLTKRQLVLVKKGACEGPGARRMSDGMRGSNMIALAKTVACSSPVLFATISRDPATFITKKQSRKSLTQKLTLCTLMKTPNTATASFKSTHDQRPTSLEQVTSTGVITRENSIMFHRRWTTDGLQMDYRCGNRARGSVDGYRHREGALKKVTPWINSLKKRGVACKLLQDGATAHRSRLARDYLILQHVEMLWWPG